MTRRTDERGANREVSRVQVPGRHGARKKEKALSQARLYNTAD